MAAMIEDEFERSTVICRACGWEGRGEELDPGETFGGGADRHCPQCGKRYRFVPTLPEDPSEN